MRLHARSSLLLLLPAGSVLLAASVLSAGCASGSSHVDGGRFTQDVPVSSTCGNTTIEGEEECDGTSLGGETCVSQGYEAGELACLGNCTFDKTACVESLCGNGSLDSGEECDGTSLGAGTCESEGFVGGTLACNPECMYRTEQCTSCGNGTIETGEECDGTAFGGEDCASRGFTGGNIACDSACGLDTNGCVNANCGNGTLETGEDCDMADLGTADCMDVGFFAGTLSCNADCTFAIANCHNCGNGSIEGIEQCDGTSLNGADCTTRGFTMGTLGCTGGCVYDASGCSSAACGNGVLESGEACDDGNAASADGCSACAVDSGWTCSGTPSSCTPICGNGAIAGGEECDGASFGGATCISLGFTGGTLGCSSTCTLVTTACTTTGCGNRTIEAGEECDDGNTVSFDGCDRTCLVDAGFYLPVRLRNGEGTNHGMLEVYQSGTWRDVCDDTYDAAARQAFADVVCRQLGFTGTGHQYLTAFGGGSGTPVMDDVYCTGTETSLAQCPFRGWNVEDCVASEAVGVRCIPAEGDIRLVSGPSGMEGRLQLYHSGAWGEVCDDYFDGYYSAYYGYSTTTVCQQMGYAGGTFVSTYDAPGDAFVLDDVNCTGTERRIGSCPHQPYGTENCSSIEGSGFRCTLHGEGSVRLEAGSARNSGRIEILHNNVWGTVCDDYLTTAGARQTNFVNVGCGQLGFTRAGSALVTTAVPDGVDPVWMDDMSCAGAETSIASCPFGGWAVENCSHYEDIGLTCTP